MVVTLMNVTLLADQSHESTDGNKLAILNALNQGGFISGQDYWVSNWGLAAQR